MEIGLRFLDNHPRGCTVQEFVEGNAAHPVAVAGEWLTVFAVTPDTRLSVPQTVLQKGTPAVLDNDTKQLWHRDTAVPMLQSLLQQIKAAHDKRHLQQAIEAFVKVGRKYDILGKGRNEIVAKYGA